VSRFRAVTGIVIVLSAVAASWIGARQFGEAGDRNLPIAPVRTGEFLAVIRTRGQIQAGRSAPIYAPMAQDLRISWMAPPGERIEQGQPMIRFDSSSAERDLIARRTARDQARANLDEAIADTALAERNDERDLVDRRLGVELAELRTVASEFVGRLEAEQGEIELRLARQNLRQLEAEIEQRAVSRESRIASLERQLAQAGAEVRIFESRIAGMELRAPLTGFPIYVTSGTSLAAALSGQAQAPLRVGDQVSAGRNLGTIPDLTSLLIDVTVEEIDRGRMRVGDEVIVRVDALPEISIRTALTAISPLAEMSFDTRGRSFHAYASLGDSADARIRPGMNGNMDIVIERVPDATIIPAQALFTRNGKPTVFLVGDAGFEPVEVHVIARNSDEIAVEGLGEDARVTLVDPIAIGSAETGNGSEGTE
jgi:hypothetical protein